jgi:hypothetical protein
MKNKLRFTNFYFALCLIMFFACNKKDIEVETPSGPEEVYACNNMLVFQSYSHVNQVIVSFNKFSQNEKKEWYKKHGIKTYG